MSFQKGRSALLAITCSKYRNNFKMTCQLTEKLFETSLVRWNPLGSILLTKFERFLSKKNHEKKSPHLKPPRIFVKFLRFFEVWPDFKYMAKFISNIAQNLIFGIRFKINEIAYHQNPHSLNGKTSRRWFDTHRFTLLWQVLSPCWFKLKMPTPLTETASLVACCCCCCCCCRWLTTSQEWWSTGAAGNHHFIYGKKRKLLEGLYYAYLIFLEQASFALTTSSCWKSLKVWLDSDVKSFRACAHSTLGAYHRLLSVLWSASSRTVSYVPYRKLRGRKAPYRS